MLLGRIALILSVSLLYGCVAAVPAVFLDNPSPTPEPQPQPEPSLAVEQVRAAGPLACAATEPASDSLTFAVSQNQRLNSSGSVIPPEAFRPVDFVPDARLENEIRAVLGDDATSYAVVIKDLKTGRGVSINARDVFYSASIFKLFVMYEVFHQQALGLLNLSDSLVMTPYYDGFGLGTRWTSLCQRLTIADALSAMMAVSDNAAAVLLQDVVGSWNVNQSLAALGLTDSRLLPDDLPLTAADVALLLEAIGRGEAVNPGASEQMIELMESEQLDNGLRAGLPDGVVLSHKTGNWDNATHDAGIVSAPCGSYLIVVLSDVGFAPVLTSKIASIAYADCQGH